MNNKKKSGQDIVDEEFNRKRLSTITAAQKERRAKYRSNRKLGMSRTNAALVSGYSRSMATRRREPIVIVDFGMLFEQKGMTNQAKVEKCIEGMNANKIVMDKNGDEHESPDWAARHKYLETMLKLCKQMDSKGGDTNMVIIGSLAERIKQSREKTNQGLKINMAYRRGMEVVVDADYEEAEEADDIVVGVDDIVVGADDGEENALRVDEEKLR